MTLITLRNLGVTLNAPLFSRLNLVVNAGDRIGLVAANGRGKSTLLRCIAGQMEPGEGEITRSRGLTIGYVEQDVPMVLMDTPFDTAVLELYAQGEITEETALTYCTTKGVVSRGIDKVKKSRGEKTTDLAGLKLDLEYRKR